LTRELLKLLNAALGIVSAGYHLQVIADQLIETLAEGLGFLSRASYELLIDREGDMWTRIMCQHPNLVVSSVPCCRYVSILLEPLQFLSHFNLAMPRVL